MQEELKKIKKLIDENKVISFDIFDTLLLRNVLSPADIFEAMSDYAKEKFAIEDFKEKRIKAESTSRVGHENNETTLQDIYKALEKEEKKDLAKLMTKELEMEKKYLVKNPFMFEVYSYAKKKKKKIYAISDMYLPKAFIEEILISFGYKMDKVYVSETHFKVKGNGSLFVEVKEKENLEYDSWLHMGDNYVSDVQNPLKLGMHAYHYLKVNERSHFVNESGTLEESILKGIIENRLYTSLEELTPWQQFGIKCVSPIYYGFTNWIYQLTKHKDNIYFLARDGYAMKEIYEKFKEKLNKDMDTYYLYCSRASYQNPTLVYCEKEFALEILTRYNADLNQKLKVKAILKAVGLEDKDYSKVLKRFDITLDTILAPDNINRVKKFLGYIYGDIKDSLNVKKDLVVKYLHQMKMDTYENVNLVDVGWAGSTQFSLNKLLPDVEFSGYYFGTLKSMYENVKYNSFGYAFDSEEPRETFLKINRNIMMYEFIVSASHGSTKGFKKEKEGVKPILGDNSMNEKYINEFQSSAIEICDEYLKYYDELKYLEASLAIRNYEKFINEKNYADLKMFRDIVESVGYDNQKIHFVPTYTKEQIKSNLANFYKEIDKSLWKDTFFIEDMDEEEFNHFKKELFSRKAKIKCLAKSFRLRDIPRLLRYPRTTLRKIKSILK